MTEENFWRNEDIRANYHYLEIERPCILLKPKLNKDGDKWCAFYGENIQEGLCAFGSTPAEAFRNFDAMFTWGFIKEEKTNA